MNWKFDFEIDFDKINAFELIRVASIEFPCLKIVSVEKKKIKLFSIFEHENWQIK